MKIITFPKQEKPYQPIFKRKTGDHYNMSKGVKEEEKNFENR